jgi:mannose-6-phosphate isomerase-like protein (cupin superfamily)
MSVKETYVTEMKKAFEKTPFASWLEDEGVKVYEGFTVEDVRELELGPWPRIGGNAVFINLYPFMEAGNGVYVAEIPPGSKLEPERWCCHKIIFLEEGTGTTEVWQEGDSQTRVFEWGPGSTFAIPINAWHRMYNLGSQPARFLVLTKAPLVMKGFDSADFIFTCPHVFKEAYSTANEKFFTEAANRVPGKFWDTNFIVNAWATPLDEVPDAKAFGGATVGFRMANRTFGGHISAWPVGRYHQAHYHDSGRLLHPLQGDGYVMTWSKELGPRPFEDGHGDDVVVEPFKPGGLYSPPGDWYHAHFNADTQAARHLAFYGRSGFEEMGPRVDNQRNTRINYEDEDPEVRRLFKEKLDKKGVPFDMPDSLYARKK